MTDYVYNSNNATTAFISKDDLARINAGREPEVGFFLFGNSHGRRSPWLHGDTNLFHAVVNRIDAECSHRFAHDPNLWVPFSNGPDLYGPDLVKHWQELASASDLLAIFGVASATIAASA